MNQNICKLNKLKKKKKRQNHNDQKLNKVKMSWNTKLKVHRGAQTAKSHLPSQRSL